MDQSGQPDFVKILDFGIAKQTGGGEPELRLLGGGVAPADNAQQQMTAAGAVMGTPPYMSPEQARGEGVTAAADQYSLGCILYEMLCGARPFQAATLRELLRLHLEAPPPALASPGGNSSVPPALGSLVQRLLAKAPQARFTELRELEAALQAIVQELETRDAAGSSRGVRSWGLWVALTVAVVALGIGASQSLRSRPARVRPLPSAGELRVLRAQALSALQKDLRAPPPLRHAAIAALGQLHVFEAVAELRPLLTDPDSVARRLAARALVLLGDPSGRQLLEAELQSGDLGAQLQASYLLCDQDSAPAQQRLVSAVGQGLVPESVQLDVLACLAAGGGSAAVRQRLVAQFRSAAQPRQRILVAARLAQLGDEEARGYLRGLAQRKGPEQLPAARALASPDETALAPLFRDVLASPHAEPGARLLASEGLGYCGELSDLTLLAPVLRGETGAPAELRQAAASAVLRLCEQDPTTLSAQSYGWAVAALSDASWATRAAAVDVLGESQSERALQLVAGLLHDPDQRVRRSAARALSRHAGMTAVRLLQAGLRDSDAEVRATTLRALRGLLGRLVPADLAAVKSEVQQLLRQLLMDATPTQELAARTLLSWLGDPTQQPLLRAMADSPDAAVRVALIEQGDPDESWLLAHLQDADFSVRFAAARRLAASGQALARTVLNEALSRGGADGILAYALLRRVDATPGSPAQFSERFAALVDTAQPLPARLAALEAAAALPAEEALALLQRAVHDPEPQVRRLVAEVAANLTIREPSGGSAEARAALLHRLSLDANAAVSARAASLLSRGRASSDLPAEPPPLVSAPALPDGGSAADGGAPIDASSGERTESVAAASTAETELERAFQAGTQAARQGNTARAVRLLSRARLLCAQSEDAVELCPRLGSQITLALAQVYEQDKRLPDAIREYQKLLFLSGSARLPAAQRSAVQRAVVRIGLSLGRVIISTRQRGVCKEETEWLPAGVQSFVTVGKQTIPVRVPVQKFFLNDGGV